MKIDVNQLTVEQLENGKLKALLPELYELQSVIENSLWHDHQSVFDHILAVFSNLLELIKLHQLSQKIGRHSRRELLMLAALLHDTAKKDALVVNQDGTASCPGHELIAAGRITNFADRFDLNRADQEFLEKLVRYHGFISQVLDLMIANQAFDKYLRIFQDTVGNASLELCLLMYADLQGSDLKTNSPGNFADREQLLVKMIKVLDH